MKKIIQMCLNCPLPVISTTNIVLLFFQASLVAQMVKESACNAGHLSSIPRLGRSPGRGDDSPLQYSCLENPHGQRSLAGYIPWGCRVRHDWATHTHTERLTHTHTHTHTLSIICFCLLANVCIKLPWLTFTWVVGWIGPYAVSLCKTYKHIHSTQLVGDSLITFSLLLLVTVLVPKPIYVSCILI